MPVFLKVGAGPYPRLSFPLRAISQAIKQGQVPVHRTRKVLDLVVCYIGAKVAARGTLNLSVASSW